MTAAELKERVSLIEVMERAGHVMRGRGDHRLLLCPWHDERTPSCHLWHDHGKCFGCGKRFDIYDILREANGGSFADAKRSLIEQVGPIGPSPRPARVRRPEPARKERLWPLLRLGTEQELATLSELRGFSREALVFAQDLGFLRFCVWRGQFAWAVTDEQREAAQVRRLDGIPWGQIDGAKAWTLPGSILRPIGLSGVSDASRVMLVEGGPDLIAASHFLAGSDSSKGKIAVVAMLGATLNFKEEDLPCFEGRHVRVYRHEDKAGRQAAKRWGEQLAGTCALVDVFNFKGLRQADGSPVEDLNDAVRTRPKQAAKLESLLP